MGHRQNVVLHPTASRASAAPREEVRQHGILRPARPLPGKSDDVVDQRVAEELAALCRKLESIGTVLTADPILRSRHGLQVQEISGANRLLSALADVVAAADKQSAISALSAGDLRARLERKPMRALLD